MFKYRFMWFHYVSVFRETIEILKWKERANNIYTFICFWQRRRINKSKWTAFLCLNTSIPMNYEVSVNWNKNVFVLSYKIHWTIWNKNITTSTLFVYYISGTIILTLLSYNKQSSNYVLLLYKDMIFSWKTHKYIFFKLLTMEYDYICVFIRGYSFKHNSTIFLSRYFRRYRSILKVNKSVTFFAIK